MLRRMALAVLLFTGFWAPPVLGHAQSVTIDDLWELREFAAYSAPISVSSDGAHLAFVSRSADLENNTYLHTVFVMDADARSAPRALTQAGGVVLRSARGRRSGVTVERVALWSADDQWLAYLVGVSSYAELWCIRRDGRGARRLSAPGEHVLDFSWAQGNTLVYRTAATASHLEARLAEADRVGFRADAAFEPIYAVAPRLDDATPLSAWRVDVATRRRSAMPLDDHPPPSSAVRIVAADAQFAGADSPLRVIEDLRASPARRCLLSNCQGELIAAWPTNHGVIFQRQTGHHGALTELALWSPQADTVRPILVTDARLTGCTYDHGALVCLEDSPLQPQRLVRFDATTGERQLLWDPNPEWSHFRLPQVERLDTTNPGGQTSYAHLVYPLDYNPGRRYPLVIVQYRSRGFLRGGTGGEHPILPLSARGYFVLSVDRPEDLSRAQTMSPNALLVAAELDGSEAAMKAIAIEQFIDALESRQLIDPDRIGITGMSDGTETLFYMLLQSERHFSAAVTSSAPPDPSAWSLLSADFRARRRQYGALPPWTEANPAWVAYWRRLSPINHMERMRTPILFNLSETETLPAMPLVARLQEREFPHDLYIYPGAYHNKWRPLQNRAAQFRAIAWLDIWLRDTDTVDAQEPDRVTRWREMRDAARLTLPR